MAALITLTTDFGTRDPYVASMKGVLLGRCPGATIVDLTHEIAPQDVTEAALFIAQAVPSFPRGTVHLVVIDPGVGTDRRPLAARAGEHLFVLPDNGLLTLLLRRMELEEARVIEGGIPGGGEVSATFHGRDVFAPAAAHLACGLPLSRVGPEAGSIARLPWPEPRLTVREDHAEIAGEIVHVDRFGNMISSIDRSSVGTRACTGVSVRGGEPIPLLHTYGAAAKGELLALWNSVGLLEIAVREGSAARLLELGKGTRVRAILSPAAALE